MTTGALFVIEAAFTTMTTSSDADSKESFALKRNVYVPAEGKLAVVVSDVALPNVTAPVGPLTLLQSFVRALPVGSPSSLADPSRFAPADSVVV